MTHTILALGAPFGHERIGWQIAEHLQHYDIDQLHTCRHPIDLIPFFAEYDHCTVIDAIHSNDNLAELVQIHPTDFQRDLCLFSHELNLYEVIQLARISEQLPEHISIFGVNVGMNTGKDGLTRFSTEQIKLLSRQVAELLSLQPKAVHLQPH